MDLSPTGQAPADDDPLLAAETVGAPADFHYATLYLPSRHRAAVRALEALRRAVTMVPEQCSDRGVAHLKLAWWNEEFARIASGAPRHPLSEALLRHDAAPRAALAALGTNLVRAVVEELQDVRFATRDAVVAHVADMHGPCWTLIFAADVGAPLAAAPLRLASLIEVAGALRGLRQHRRGGTLYLASEALAAHGLTAVQVREARSSADIEPLAIAELRWLRDQIALALTMLDARERRSHAPLLTLARCTIKALDLTLEDGCRLLERRIELLPVHKLWVAWRSHHLPRW